MKTSNLNILSIFAHPDDETILAGGTFALLAKLGVPVHYLCATRGEGGEIGEPPICSQANLGAVREVELGCAVDVLHGVSLSFLDYVDPLVGENDELHPYTDDIDELVSRILEVFNEIKLEVVVTHGSNGEYGHPAHLLTHQAVIQAVNSYRGDQDALYTASACFKGHPKARVANKDDQADLVVDVTSVLDLKESAALCHRTQNALFVRRSSKAAGRRMSVREVLMGLEGFHQVIPAGTTREVDPLSELLADWLVPGEECDV